MEAKIQKWGNSLGIRIPINIIKDLSLKNGSVVNIDEETNKIVIRPKETHDLNQLLQSISETNLHTEMDFGKLEGTEIW